MGRRRAVFDLRIVLTLARTTARERTACIFPDSLATIPPNPGRIPVAFLTMRLVPVPSIQKVTMLRRPIVAALSVLALALLLAACGSSGGSGKQLALVAY